MIDLFWLCFIHVYVENEEDEEQRIRTTTQRRKVTDLSVHRTLPNHVVFRLHSVQMTEIIVGLEREKSLRMSS